MIVHVIEDNSLKATELRLFLRGCLPNADVLTQASYQTGLRAAEEGEPDLVLLDMTLPSFDRQPGTREGRMRPLGGYELLRKLRLKGLRAKVIVVSQLETFGEEGESKTFQQISDQCATEFPDLYLGSVYFAQSDRRWRGELEALIAKHFGGEMQGDKDTVG